MLTFHTEERRRSTLVPPDDVVVVRLHPRQAAIRRRPDHLELRVDVPELVVELVQDALDPGKLLMSDTLTHLGLELFPGLNVLRRNPHG
jgi:hypothetical protein